MAAFKIHSYGWCMRRSFMQDHWIGLKLISNISSTIHTRHVALATCIFDVSTYMFWSTWDLFNTRFPQPHRSFTPSFISNSRVEVKMFKFPLNCVKIPFTWKVSWQWNAEYSIDESNSFINTHKSSCSPTPSPLLLLDAKVKVGVSLWLNNFLIFQLL